MISDPQLVIALRSLAKEVGHDHNIEICEGGRIPTLDVSEDGIWEYTNPAALKIYLNDSHLNPLSLAYTNVHYGKVLEGEDWFNENIFPLFESYEKLHLPQKKSEFQNVMR